MTVTFDRARALGRTFGPTLYQLPPRWKRNVDRLEAFLRALPKRRRHAIEFRDPSWYVDEVFALLQQYRVALCLHDMAGSASARLDATTRSPRRYPSGDDLQFGFAR